MSIQWTFIAGYLYFEIGIVSIMMLPLFSPKRWHQFFRSRLFAMFQEHAAVYFYVLLGVLGLFLLDAIREIRKYSHSSESGHAHLSSEMKGNVKLFRAQRNFYITGFAIFLAFVIRRLVKMLIIQDELCMKADKITKEAEATVQLAKSTVLASTLQTNELIKCEDLKKELELTKDLLAKSTVLASTLQTNELIKCEDLKKELELTKDLLEGEKIRAKELEVEATKWRLKYEELTATANGKGDELITN